MGVACAVSFSSSTLSWVREAMCHPGMIGWHWFKYGHDTEDFTVGMVDSDFKAFDDMLQLMGQLNERVYPMLLK